MHEPANEMGCIDNTKNEYEHVKERPNSAHHYLEDFVHQMIKYKSSYETMLKRLNVIALIGYLPTNVLSLKKINVHHAKDTCVVIA